MEQPLQCGDERGAVGAGDQHRPLITFDHHRRVNVAVLHRCLRRAGVGVDAQVQRPRCCGVDGLLDPCGGCTRASDADPEVVRGGRAEGQQE